MTEVAMSVWRQEQLERLRRGLALFCYVAIVIFVLFWGLDLVIYPELAFEFLALRVLCALGYLPALVVIAYAKTSTRATVVGVCLIWWVSAIICVMLTKTGYERSLYYAGLIVTILAMGVIFPWTWPKTFVVGMGMAGMFVVVATMNPAMDLRATINNTGFILGGLGIALAANIRSMRVSRMDFDGRQKLATAYDQVRQLNEMQARFFANISHELRTPLTLIIGPLEDLLARPGSPAGLRVIHNNAGRLLRLIDELLDLSRVDAGGLRLNVSEVDVGAMVASVTEDMAPAADAKKLALVVGGHSTTPDVFGDAHRLEIVLTNLIGNALKYTPDGGTISVRVADTSDGATVEVNDNGPGISADDLPHVFDRFYQASSGSERRQKGGVGIGLALAKELTELHDGTLTVESELGVGTTFRLWLPKGRDHFRADVVERRERFQPEVEARRREDAPRDVMPQATGDEIADVAEMTGDDEGVLLDGRRARILLVEDQPELRAFVAQLLSPMYEILEAEDGDDGLSKVKKERPDLVLSDVMMPGRSGADLCKEIKRDPVLRATPVILLTARVGSEATLEAYAHGADDFVAKPFHPQVLLARVHAQLRLRAMGLRVASREKLAAIGTLAAGVAHEVRNPINAIINAAGVLLNQTLDDETEKKMLSIIADGAGRIDAVVGALMAHARPAEASMGDGAPCDVREGLDATLLLLDHRMDGIKVHRNYATECSVRISAGPANQVFLNLIDNAILSGAHNIWINVGRKNSRKEGGGEKKGRQEDIGQKNGHIEVVVGDDGPGVAEEIVDRIFDPFFTTRPPGKGTGLGLHLSRTIAMAHGGSLYVRQREGAGGGCEFVLELQLYE